MCSLRMTERANSKCRQISYVPALGSNTRRERALERKIQPRLEREEEKQLWTVTRSRCKLERESCRPRARPLNKTGSTPTIPRRRPKHGEHRQQRELTLSILSLTESCRSVSSSSSETSSIPSQTPSPPLTIPIITVTNADLPPPDILTNRDYQHRAQALSHSTSTIFSKDSRLLRRSRQPPHNPPRRISHRTPGRVSSNSTESIVKLPSIDHTPSPKPRPLSKNRTQLHKLAYF